MCLLVIAYKHHSKYPLVVLANRDEYYDRPSAPARFWEEAPFVLGGKDLRGGGTWLGITTAGKIAAITNYRDPKSVKSEAPSRGILVRDFLMGDKNARQYLAYLLPKASEYNGFNLILGDMRELYWYSNRGQGPQLLGPGLYGLSNHLLDTPWPKVTKAKREVSKLLASDELPSDEAFFELLMDRVQAEDSLLPNTGVGLEWERILSPIFISSPIYGTRSSTLIFVDAKSNVRFIEKTYNNRKALSMVQTYEFKLDDIPTR